MMLRAMRPLLRHYSPTIASGILLAWSFPAFHWWPLAWVALAPLVWRVAPLTPRAAAIHFFLAGWVFHSLVLQWLVANIFWAGGWAVIGQQLLCVALSLFWAGLGALWIWGRGRVPAVYGAGALALLWGGMEWLHANLFTGFGWSALGYTQGPNLVFAQLAAVGGVSLLSMILVYVAASIGLVLSERRGFARLAAAAAVAALAHGAGYLWLDRPRASESDFTAGIFQSDFSQEMKWDWEYAEEMATRAAYHSRRLAAFERVDLFVWPEALLVWPFDDPRMRGPVRELIAETGVPLLTGATRDGPSGRAEYNSAALFNASGEVVDHYDKIHLAPMGEYIPFEQYLPFLAGIVPGGGISAGETPKVFNFGQRRLGPLVCFEVLFAPMSEQLRRMGADCLVVVTNLGWFGASNAIPQVLEIARFRAIETRLPLIHSANTGISGVFDPWGRFTAVNGAIGSQGRYVKWEEGELRPADVRNRRMVGALRVGGAASRPLPLGPPVFPWAMLVAAVALIALAFRGPAQAPPTGPATGEASPDDISI